VRVNPNENSQLFTASGTFVAPPGFTKVYIFAMGAGGGGGGGGDAGGGVGGGGGAGDTIWRQDVTVIPGNSYTVTIGTGGAGGTGGVTNTNGSVGGATIFGSAVTMNGGGGGGRGGRNPATVPGGGGAPGGPGACCGAQSVFGVPPSGGAPGLNTGPASRPPDTICFAATVLLLGGLVALKLLGWIETPYLLIPPVFFPLMAYQAPYGAGGSGGAIGSAGGQGGGGMCLVVWGQH